MTPLDPCSHFGPHLHVSIIGTYALNCKLTVKYRTLQGLCSVNGKTFLDFGDENHEGNATMLCPALYQSLTDISEVMWSLQSGKYGTECKGRHDE